MSSRRHLLAKLGAVFATLTLAGTATAGIAFQQVVTMQGGDGGRRVNQVRMDGEAVRIDFVEIRGGAADPSAPTPFVAGDYMIVRPGESLIVRPASRTYSRLDMGALNEMVASAQAMQAQAGMQITYSDVDVALLLEEDSPEIAGHPTRHYRWRKTHSTDMSTGQGSLLTEFDVTEDYWVTPDFELPAGAESGFGLAGTATAGAAKAAEADAVIRAQMGGFPLKHVSVAKTSSRGTRLMSMMPTRSETVTTTSELSDVRVMDIPASTFGIPEGYTERSLLP